MLVPCCLGIYRDRSDVSHCVVQQDYGVASRELQVSQSVGVDLAELRATDIVVAFSGVAVLSRGLFKHSYASFSLFDHTNGMMPV
jgi:uncharacterized membrane protein (UPF0136 family)